MKITKIYVVSVLTMIVIGLVAFTTNAQAPSSLPTPKQPEKPLDKTAVASLIEEFSRNLWDLLSDEEAAETIVNRWKERKDLVGKTRSQAIHRLYEDVVNVVDDSKKTGKVWDTWETNERNPPKPPTKPPPVTEDECAKAKMEQGTVKFYDDRRGYGYIIRKDGTEVFLHHTVILGSGDALKLKEADRVRFTVFQGPNGVLAKCVAKFKK